MLRKAKFLDPRRVPNLPIKDSVNIPARELAGRVYELPRQHSLVTVAAIGDEATEAADWLRANEREAELSNDFEFGESDACRLWWPNGFLEHVIPNLEPGSAIDLACGAGREAVFLADFGYTVTAIDHLSDALEMGRTLERRYLTAAEQIDWRRQDLEAETPQGRFDLATCFLFMNRTLLASIPKMLNPGGSFIFETFTTINRETLGKPRREAFAVKPGELRELMPDLDVQIYNEDWHEGRHTAQFWGRLPG